MKKSDLISTKKLALLIGMSYKDINAIIEEKLVMANLTDDSNVKEMFVKEKDCYWLTTDGLLAVVQSL